MPSPPFFEKAIFAMAYFFDKPGYPTVAVVLCVSFARLLRGKEFLSLRACLTTSPVIVAKRTSSSHEQSRYVSEEGKKACSLTTIASCNSCGAWFPRLPLANLTTGQFRAMINKALAALSLPGTFRPYSRSPYSLYLCRYGFV